SEMAGYDDPYIFACGKKAVAYFKSKNIPVEKECVFNDIPTYEESSALLDELIAWRRDGRISDILIIYPRYVNMMTQTPTVSDLFCQGENAQAENVLYFPDIQTIITRAADTVFRSMFYDLVLQTAIGAQASTLLTMRSAFDTASEYCISLEGEINRMRQSAVTADVLETSTESSW
ncbi:MAG: F0F1 ATP synthase subunit gamma, partial [Oscillospiraceae bacterium]|nr:F0F1 ATP synthase subunit gamma [Oscillospiraceae bacterium]